MAIRHSHNCYWCNNPIEDSIKQECTMFEIDVVYSCNQIYLSHSWRPLGLLSFGSPFSFISDLIDYKFSHVEHLPQLWYLYIELKTGEYDSIPLLLECLDLIKAAGANIQIIMGANDGNWFSKTFQKREVALNKFLNLYGEKYNIIRMCDLAKTEKIISVDVFEKSIFHF